MFRTIRRIILVFCIGALVSGLALNTAGQDMTSGSGVFEFKRPKDAGASSIKSAYKSGKPLPQRKKQGGTRPKDGIAANSTGKFSNKRPLVADEIEQLGITLWRLRPERPDDTGARLLTMNKSAKDAQKMVAERVAMDTVFEKGEKVRISVESPRSGYLYIIDREIFKDGTVGEPYLIFPTLLTHGGDNRVSEGKVIEIPAQSDVPYYFDIDTSQKNYNGELLTVIVSPEKIRDLQLTDKPLQLKSSLVDEWEEMWERSSTSFELAAGRGVAYTEEEKEAGVGLRLLTQKSPSPQTLIAVQAPKGKAFLVSFPMKVAN